MKHVIDRCLLRIECHPSRIVRKVYRNINDTWKRTIVLFYICSAIRAVHAFYRKANSLFHFLGSSSFLTEATHEREQFINRIIFARTNILDKAGMHVFL